MEKPLVYLAAPYTHADPAVELARFEAVNLAAAKLMAAGLLVFSPVSHSHSICLSGRLSKAWGFWESVSMAYLDLSHRIVVLKLEGWDRSVGVTAEIEAAQKMGLEIEYMEPLETEDSGPF